MTEVGWFSAGLFVASLIGLITTTTPSQAWNNLKEWSRFYDRPL